MYLRVLAFLLAVLMTAGIAFPTVAASPDPAGLVDDGAPDPDPAIAVSPVLLAPAVRRELEQIVAPVAELRGRLHGGWVFRPPRRVAAR
ncbi:MAG TPA: hypothetical protein VF469_09750 [Kofleriaceae bacterium]